jgi:hypothetical protein
VSLFYLMMLPEKLSTDFTSLNFESDRLAIIGNICGGVDRSRIVPRVIVKCRLFFDDSVDIGNGDKDFYDCSGHCFGKC